MADARHTSEQTGYRIYVAVLLLAFVSIWLLLAWRPSYREDWLLENLLVFLAVPGLVASFRRLPLSRVSYGALFLFLCLHSVGAHYTYSEVPYDQWWRAAFGTELNPLLGWERNHYDRMVHFLYGVLVTYPVREVFLRIADVRGLWAYLFPLLVVMSSSLLFELLEWAAALVVAGELGMAYLGTQGDVWDSHKDSALATAGSCLTTLIVAAVHYSLDRDFSREWAESLRVKHAEPLGEFAVDRYLDEDQER